MKFNIKSAKQMPPGQYYIGDLCYVMSDEWNEFCEITIIGNNVDEGHFRLKDGRQFVFFNTMYGDGVYTDRQGRQYPVDAGLIGAILVEDISPADRKNTVYGNIVSFSETWCAAKSTQGILYFGNDVEIDTAGNEDEEYDESF